MRKSDETQMCPVGDANRSYQQEIVEIQV